MNEKKIALIVLALLPIMAFHFYRAEQRTQMELRLIKSERNYDELLGMLRLFKKMFSVDVTMKDVIKATRIQKNIKKQYDDYYRNDLNRKLPIRGKS